MTDDKKNKGQTFLEKIVTVIRDDSRVLREAVMDQSGSRLYEKQIAEAKSNLQQAKSAISDELAKELQASRQVKLLDEQITCQEHLIMDAMKDKDEKLAFELATEMVGFEQDREAKLVLLERQQKQLAQLHRQMEFAERELQELERQMAMVRTSEDIQRATDVITNHLSEADAKMLSAKKALERIRSQQDKKSRQDDEPLKRLTAETDGAVEALSDQQTVGKDANEVLRRIRDKEQ